MLRRPAQANPEGAARAGDGGLPAATSAAPAMIATSGTAAGRCAAGTSRSAEPAASAEADVVVITISRVLAVSPPMIGPAKLAYRPWTGLTPAKMAAAMPSGTLPTAPGTPASRSRTRCRRCGATERSHSQAARLAGLDLDFTA